MGIPVSRVTVRYKLALLFSERGMKANANIVTNCVSGFIIKCYSRLSVVRIKFFNNLSLHRDGQCKRAEIGYGLCHNNSLHA